MINTLNAAQPIVEQDGNMSQQMRTVMSQVVKESLIIGTGSPEGVVIGLQGQEYMDDAGLASAIKYIKRDADDGSGDTTKGWILI